MSVPIKGDKLLRLNYIVANQTNRTRLINKLKGSYTEATAIEVKDLGGMVYEYKPFFGEKTRNPFRIPKKIVEEYNVQLIEDANENELEIPDIDSLAVLKAQLDYWLEQSVLGETIEFTNTDLVAINVVSGEDATSNFVYTYAKDGLLDSSIIGRQKRFNVVRLNVGDVIAAADAESIENEKLIEINDGAIVIDSTHAHEIMDILIEVIGKPEINEEDGWDAYDEPMIFAEDIALPVTHFVPGFAYTATIRNEALDYYGLIDFRIYKEPIPPEDEPETPPVEEP